MPPTPQQAAGSTKFLRDVVIRLATVQGAGRGREEYIPMRVEHIYRYPVKGLTAEALEEVRLTPGQCLPHDRRFALAQGDAPLDPAAPSWLPKRHFGCLAQNARLALLH